MYVVTCPGCARPSAVSLAHPDMMACDACGYRGPIPEDARRPNLDGVQTVGAEWFVGRSGSGHRSGGNEVSGRIERVHGDLMGASAYGVIGRDSVFIEGFCLEPDQAQAP
jgi:hypothetical protein